MFWFSDVREQNAAEAVICALLDMVSYGDGRNRGLASQNTRLPAVEQLKRRGSLDANGHILPVSSLYHSVIDGCHSIFCSETTDKVSKGSVYPFYRSILLVIVSCYWYKLCRDFVTHILEVFIQVFPIPVYTVGVAMTLRFNFHKCRCRMLLPLRVGVSDHPLHLSTT